MTRFLPAVLAWVALVLSYPFWAAGYALGWILGNVRIGAREGARLAELIAFPPPVSLGVAYGLGVDRPDVIPLPYLPSSPAAALDQFRVYKHCPCGFPAVSPEDLVHHLDQVHPLLRPEDRADIEVTR